MKPKPIFLFLFIACFCCSLIHSQGLRVQGKKIVDKNGKEIILRGIGFGGWMLQEPYMLGLSGIAATQHDIRSKIATLIGKEKTEEFYTTWLSNHCTKADIDSLAAWGFNSVRLPMHYNLFTLPSEEEKGDEQTGLQKGFALTDSLLTWCKAAKIYLILDLHAAPGGQGNDIAIADRDTTKPYLWTSESNKQKTIALWEKLATRYKDEEWIGAYDLINEPNYGFQNVADKNGCAEKENAPLKALYIELTKTIRKVDQKHILIIEGNCWGNNYNGMFPLWDDNMMASFHKYWNYTDQASIQNVLDIREKNNVPIWCGETGENSNVWFTDVISLLERNSIGWAMWPLKKMGGNNPLQIKTNEGYQKLIDYWRGKSGAPRTEETEAALLQLAKDASTDKNIFHKDVVDAMFRQVNETSTLPYKNNVLQNKLILFATDYDLGRNGYAYSDKDTGNYWVATTKHTDGNQGRRYRNDGVDIGECNDATTNSYCVGWIEDDEWMQYTIFNQTAGTYALSIRYAAKEKDGKLKLVVNNESPVEVVLPKTTNAQPWQTVSVPSLRLAKGRQMIRVVAENGGFELNYLEFLKK